MVIGFEIPDNHREIAASYNNIGMTLYASSEYRWSLAYFSMSAEIQVKALGQSHPDSLNSLDNMGYAFEGMEGYVRALQYFVTTLNERIKSLGEWHPQLITCYQNIGRVYAALGDEENARICQERIELIRKNYTSGAKE